MTKHPWVAFFSMTGSEIQKISQRLEINPDKIFIHYNKRLNPVDFVLNSEINNKLIKNKPNVEDFDCLNLYEIIGETPIITLHGFLRIVPPEICSKFKIYNCHPGDIITYPELKGLDPQKKAVELKLPTTGVVIHEVSPELDSGEIVAYREHIINYDFSTNTQIIDNLTSELKAIAVDLWVDFLSTKL